MNKYRAVRTEIDNITFASKKEAARYQELRFLEKAGEIKDLRLQVPFKFQLNGVHICKYLADFVFKERKNGYWIEVVEDTKGRATRDYRIKKRMMKAFFAIDVRES